MARAPNENITKAYELYKKGYKLVEISNELNVPEGTIRSWKNRYKWDNDKTATLQEKKRNVANKNKSKKEAIVEEVIDVLDNTELTDKQRLFCIYYIKYFNATKAAMKAGYSKETAGEQGYQLLQKTSIKGEIQRLKQNKLNRVMLSEDDIFQKYIDIAFADITDYVEFGQEEIEGKKGPYINNYVRFKNDSEVDGSLISEVKKGKDGVSIKLHDKMRALQWLSDRMDLLPTNIKEKINLEKAKFAYDIQKDQGGNKNNALAKSVKAKMESRKAGNNSKTYKGND